MPRHDEVSPDKLYEEEAAAIAAADGGVDFDVELGKRPQKEAPGYAWDIATKYGRSWFTKYWTDASGDSMAQIAKTAGVDPVALMVVAVANFGKRPPNADALIEFANAFALRGPRQSLDRWFRSHNPERWAKLIERDLPALVGGRPKSRFLPAAIIKVTDNGEGRKYREPPLAPGTRRTVWDKVERRWKDLIPGIAKIANREYPILDGTDSARVDTEMLVAVLFARGFTPEEINKDLNSADQTIVTETAATLATHRSGTIDSWFTENYGDPAGKRPKPSVVLKDAPDTRIPKSTAERLADEETRQDVVNPVKITLTGGIEIRLSDYEEFRTKYRDLTLWYTGVLPEEEELTRWITDGTSDYQVSVELSQRPGFFRSPAWKSHSETYKGIFREMVGTEHKLPKHLIRKAIVHSWDEGDFSEQLRQRPIYLEGNEFKSGTATLQNIYLTVQGGPITSGVKTALKEAVLARWSKDQFTSWLRAQPEYETGREHGRKVRKFNAGLASFFGQPLSRVDLPIPQPVTAFDLPDSDRIEGAGDISTEQFTETPPDPLQDEVA